ncbi:G-type lectin S-receptor-like serine/threonine-protein kinase SD2-5 [Lolium perenne]|uniref:G-type lectin S-receptor-like serine/threonine-protein kinase SD2-5 n=1 Tax=Lolium perenne TaxID=4522 RepID=UPI0021EAEC36|nr:G-type lectin S-receptor-like serine/threonine-protein kinase SD2-5 [Lolium perenne]
MGPAIVFFLVLASAAPLLLASQVLGDYPTPKPSTVWINNNVFFKDSDSRNIIPRVVVPDSNSEIYTDAGFHCVPSIFQCDQFLFAVSIGNSNTQQMSRSFNQQIAGFADTRQIIWSANRDRPVRENATLEFTTHGNLVLRDADGSQVWSSNSSGQSVAGMVIKDVGNLVLFDHNNRTVWQSFYHPTDTLVLGQSLVEGMRLTSNTSATNTTEGMLYITVLPGGLYAFIESTPPQCYFLNPLRQNKTTNDPTKVTFMSGSLTTYQSGQSDFRTNLVFAPATSTQFMRLEYDGHLRVYGWSVDRWTPVYDVMTSMEKDDCDYPTVCGEYGICTERQCGCPVETNSSSSYFKLVDEHKPNLGCTPITPISCQEIQHHRLLTLPNIDYFDESNTAANATSIDDCKQACLKNCSCMAVSFRYKWNAPHGKCVWVTKVFSLKSIQPYDGYNSSTYIKVQLSPPTENRTTVQPNPSSENKTKVMLGASLGAVMALVLVVIVVALYLKRRRNYVDEEFDFDQFPGIPTRYSFERLSECTEGFSKKLGEGGFGSVFEGKLGENRVAVKRLEGARQGKKEFLAEVETIGSIEHINLVRLIGFCVEKFERLLVYEYMSGGSLDRWIYYRHNNAPLDWSTRCRIILDIAKGLCYLHEDCRRKIAHLDIKPQNILLDDNFNAKVADFGLCKLIDRDQSKVVTMMRGTPGYLAPEWLTSRITEKVDVYSFGVVIMEIISGRKNIDNSQPEENVQLINLLREKAQNNQLIDLIDKHSDDMLSQHEEVVQMMKLAIWCLQHDSIQRPSMAIVIKVLEGAISIQTFDANSITFAQDNPSAYSAPSQASILSGPR